MRLDSGNRRKGYHLHVDGNRLQEPDNLDTVYDYETSALLSRRCRQDKPDYAKSFYTQYCNTDPFAGKRLVEPYREKTVWLSRTRLPSP